MSAPDSGGATPFRDGWPLLQPTGFRLHPLDGKKPILKDWPNEATNDENILRQWGMQYGTYNIGIVLGHYPEQGRTYFVIDLDLSKTDGTYGGDSLNEHRLARSEPPLPPTLIQRTGGGGYQLFFFTESGLAIPNKVGILSGVDIRGDGGQVATVPSIHPETYVPYAWQSLEPVALAPRWILELAGAYERGTQRRTSSGKQDTAAEGDPIPEHERNETLFKIASALRAKGLTRNAIFGQLYDINQARCQPPIELEDLNWIADSVMKYPPTSSDMPNWPPKDNGSSETPLPPPPGEGTTVDDELRKIDPRNTDRYNGLEFAAAYAGLLIWTEQQGWLTWDGHRWRQDTLLEHKRLVGNLVNTLWAMSGQHPEDRELYWNRIKRLESSSGATNCLNEAKPFLARDITDFDQDPWLINFTNGTLDLRTFELRRPDAIDLITRTCTVEYHPEAVDPWWEDFLVQAIPDEDMRLTFQAFMGSCLTGDTRDKSILLPYGDTDTGKSTAIEPCVNVLGRIEEGGYAASWTADVVERGRQQGLDEKKNQVRGARLIVVGELTRGARFNDGFIKQFSGGDTVSARALYKGSYGYRPTAKLVMHTNFVPTSSDRATQNRLKLLPFKHKFEPRDEGVKRYFEENPQAQVAIAAWLVRGAQVWTTNGLGKMPWLESIMHAYDLDSNPVAAFIEEVLEPTEILEESIGPDEMWNQYQAYEMTRGGKPWHRRTFERALEERGLERQRVPKKGGPVRWVGWKLRYVPSPPGQEPYSV